MQFNSEGYTELKEAVKSSCADLGLKAIETQVRKVVELYEQLSQRMGVVIVGPSGSGKTTLFTILKAALAKLGKVGNQIFFLSADKFPCNNFLLHLLTYIQVFGSPVYSSCRFSFLILFTHLL